MARRGHGEARGGGSPSFGRVRAVGSAGAANPITASAICPTRVGICTPTRFRPLRGSCHTPPSPVRGRELMDTFLTAGLLLVLGLGAATAWIVDPWPVYCLYSLIFALGVMWAVARL